MQRLVKGVRLPSSRTAKAVVFHVPQPLFIKIMPVLLVVIIVSSVMGLIAACSARGNMSWVRGAVLHVRKELFLMKSCNSVRSVVITVLDAIRQVSV